MAQLLLKPYQVYVLWVVTSIASAICLQKGGRILSCTFIINEEH